MSTLCSVGKEREGILLGLFYTNAKILVYLGLYYTSRRYFKYGMIFFFISKDKKNHHDHFFPIFFSNYSLV